MKKVFQRDSNYYFGLLFLIVACFSIPWCYLKDAFEPVVFLIFFLFYCAGFALLWKSDTSLRIAALLDEIAALKEKSRILEEDISAFYRDLSSGCNYNINQRALRRRGILY
ncbi:MAG: hypothetical protein ACM3WV_03120 [Bacillota bacterium]